MASTATQDTPFWRDDSLRSPPSPSGDRLPPFLLRLTRGLQVGPVKEVTAAAMVHWWSMPRWEGGAVAHPGRRSSTGTSRRRRLHRGPGCTGPCSLPLQQRLLVVHPEGVTPGGQAAPFTDCVSDNHCTPSVWRRVIVAVRCSGGCSAALSVHLRVVSSFHVVQRGMNLWWLLHRRAPTPVHLVWGSHTQSHS